MEGRMVSVVNAAMKPAVEKSVNGYIREMSSKLDLHIVEHKADTAEVKEFMAEMAPIVGAYKGSKILGEGLKWLAGVGVAFLAIKGFWKP